MKNELFAHASGSAPDNPNWQTGFNNLVDSYNDDFLFFLRRAASGRYKGLMNSGRVLKDSHNLLTFVQRANGLKSEAEIFPFEFNHKEEYYRLLDFDNAEIERIRGFFNYVSKTFNKDFEACMREDTEFLCSKP